MGVSSGNLANFATSGGSGITWPEIPFSKFALRLSSCWPRLYRRAKNENSRRGRCSKVCDTAWNAHIYMSHSTSNRTLLFLHISDFLWILLISRAQASTEKAAKKTWKSQFPAKLHPLKVANFARLPLDMPLFTDLWFSSFWIEFNAFLFIRFVISWAFESILNFLNFLKNRINTIKTKFQTNI